jgi:acetyl esterase/lipase
LAATRTDETAFVAFYDRYESAVVGYLGRRVADPETVADLTAEVFVAALGENEGILLNFQDNRATMAYGIEAFNARNPLAWPRFATRQDVVGLPPTVVSVNECDPLRDEGIAFYRLLMDSGVSARCRQNMGACHGLELLLPGVCSDIARSTARDIADFAITSGGFEQEG